MSTDFHLVLGFASVYGLHSNATKSPLQIATSPCSTRLNSRIYQSLPRINLHYVNAPCHARANLRMTVSNSPELQSSIQEDSQEAPEIQPGKKQKGRKRKHARSNPLLAEYPEVDAAVPPSVPARVTNRVAAGCQIRVAGAAAGHRVSAIIAGARERRIRSTLVIAPTLAAALRCAAEAEANYPEACVVTEVGSGNKDFLKTPVREARKASISVLVGTPRGLCSRFTALENGKDHVTHVELLVLYDMEYLLKIGWMKELMSIHRLVRQSPTQTVVVTDTVDAEIMNSIVPTFLPEEYETVYWIDKSRQGVIAGTEIKKVLSVVPVSTLSIARALACLLTGLLGVSPEPAPCRILVYFPTGRFTQMYAGFLSSILGFPVHEVHMNKTTRHCGRAIASFRNENRAILFSSDMSAQGSELCGVNAIIHVFVAKDAEQYKQRQSVLAEGGTSITLLHEYEVEALRKMDVSLDDFEKQEITPGECKLDAKLLNSAVDANVRIAAYHSWLGYYASKRKSLGWSRQDLVDQSVVWYKTQALIDKPPALPKKTVDRLYLRGVNGIEVEYTSQESPKVKKASSKKQTRPSKTAKQ